MESGDTTDLTNPIAYQAYYTTLVAKIVLLIVGFLLTAVTIFATKVAQAGVLPTCIFKAPYEGIESMAQHEGTNFLIDTNIAYNSVGKVTSTKIMFSSDENNARNNNTFQFLREWTSGPNSSKITLYVGSVLAQLLVFDFNMIGVCFNAVNSVFSQTFLVFLAPFYLICVIMFISITSSFYFVYLYLANLWMLFSKPAEVQADVQIVGKTYEPMPWYHVDNPNGEVEGDSTWWSICWAVIKFCFRFFIYCAAASCIIVIGLGVGLPVSMFMSLYCIFYTTFCPAKKLSEDMPYTIRDTLTDFLKNKKAAIMYIFTAFLMADTYSNFGPYVMFISLTACVLLGIFTTVYRGHVSKVGDGSTEGLAQPLFKANTFVCPVPPKKNSLPTQIILPTSTPTPTTEPIERQPQTQPQTQLQTTEPTPMPTTPTLPVAQPISEPPAYGFNEKERAIQLGQRGQQGQRGGGGLNRRSGQKHRA